MKSKRERTFVRPPSRLMLLWLAAGSATARRQDVVGVVVTCNVLQVRTGPDQVRPLRSGPLIPGP